MSEKPNRIIRYAGSLIIALLLSRASIAGTYQLAADYSTIDSYPLQKTQFGLSYTGSSSIDMENVYEVLKARNTRNNDKRLRGTWAGWDASGNPVYERNNRVSTLLENAGKYGAVGGANLQGPYEHPAVDVYRISTQKDNRWKWSAYSRHSVLYHKHLRELIDSAGFPDYPFVFGIGHEVNNDANLDTYGLGDGCVDGIAFMGNLDTFHDLVITKGNKRQGDVIQASNYFNWYQQTMDGLCYTYGDRSQFLITAGQSHTSPYAIGSFMNTFKNLVDAYAMTYVPDYIGSHARWNIPGNERFFQWIVGPSRELFADPAWMAVSVQCNEFGIYDFDPAYQRSMLGAVRLLTNYERMLKAPDIGYVNFIYNERFESGDGMFLHPAFHAFRFYQNMPQSRTRLKGEKPSDMHVLSSMAAGSKQAAMIWRDGTGSGTDTVNFTFANVPAKWQHARASLYLLSSDNPESTISSSRKEEDFGMAGYMADDYPKIIHGHDNLQDYTFKEISLPSASVALLLLERMEVINRVPSIVADSKLNNSGPRGAVLIKSWQWTGRDGAGGVDPAWGYFDTRNWTLFAGIDDVSGPGGSVTAGYLSGDVVKRGMAGAEFKCSPRRLKLEIDIETGNLNPPRRNYESIGAIRVDFYNGNSGTYDGAVILAGNCFPEIEDYSEDHVAWGYGGNNVKVLPQQVLIGQVGDETEIVIDLDEMYSKISASSSVDSFVAGGRRIIVSAWVENVEAGMVVRLGNENDVYSSKE